MSEQDNQLCDVDNKVFPNRGFSWRIFRYVLKDYLIILGCIVTGFLLFSMVFQLMDDLNDFDGKTVQVQEIITYFLCLLPEKLKYIMPMSLLLATMWIMFNMSKNNEITALRAVGVSILQAFFPFLAISCIFAGFQLYSSEHLAPRATERAENIMQAVGGQGSKRGRKTERFLAYRNSHQKRDWLIRSIDHKGNCTGIFIQQFDQSKHVTWELQAESGSYDKSVRGWHFTKVERRIFKEGEAFPTVEELSNLTLELPENPKAINFFAKLRIIDELTIVTIWHVLFDDTLKIPPATRNILWTSLIFRLSFPLSCVISVLLGVPMAVTSHRTGAMKSLLIAIGVMASYYVVSQLFVVIGNLPASNPLISGICGGLPVAGYIAFGIYQLIRKL